MRADTHVGVPHLRLDLVPLSDDDRSTTTDRDGRFRFEDVAPGTREAVAWGQGLVPDLARESSLGAKVDVEAGQTARMEIKGALRLQVEGWPRTEPLPGPAHQPGASFACWPLDAPTQILRGIPTPEGLVEFEDLVPGRRYACLVRNLANPDIVAFAGDLPADGELHRVSRSPVVPICGRVVLPDGFYFHRLHVVDGDVEVGQLVEGGR